MTEEAIHRLEAIESKLRRILSLLDTPPPKPVIEADADDTSPELPHLASAC